MKIGQFQGREAMRGQIEKLFDLFFFFFYEKWHTGVKLLRYDTKKF